MCPRVRPPIAAGHACREVIKGRIDFSVGRNTMKIESTRRTFFGAAAGIAGLSAIGVRPAAAVIEPEPWGIKLGVASYSLRMFDRAKAIEMIKALKIPYVSIKDVHLKQTDSPEVIEAGAKEFRDAGLKITSGGNVDLKETTVE